MFDCDSTTAMRYSTQNKQFWKLGWKKIGGKFVNFMADYKSHGNTTLKMSQRGNYPHPSSEINVAVPDVKVLRDLYPYAVNGKGKHDIHTDIISKLCENLRVQSACITFDETKIKTVPNGRIGRCRSAWIRKIWKNHGTTRRISIQN